MSGAGGGCVFIDDGTTCGADAAIYQGLSVCDRHLAILAIRRRGGIDGRIAEYFATFPDAEHVPGWTYVLLLPNGRVKLGYTSNDLLGRFQEAHRKRGSRVIVLAVAPGGWTRESLLHWRFREHRVDELGEQFQLAPEIAQLAAEWGIHPDAQPAVDAYRHYVPMTERRTSTEGGNQ
jgi:hypothetical protein